MPGPLPSPNIVLTTVAKAIEKLCLKPVCKTSKTQTQKIRECNSR